MRKLFEEERIAKSLFKEVNDFITKRKIDAHTKLEGAGVHWDCIITSKDTSVDIYCCDLSKRLDKVDHHEEFIVFFYQGKNEICCGRSYDRKKVIESVENWIVYQDISKLYENYDYVDKGIRLSKEYEKEWLENEPELVQTHQTIINHGSGIIKYKIEHKDRACWYTTTGEHEELSITFSIDECSLFETKACMNELAIVLKRYLIDRENISSLSKEFDWIISNDLVKAYESGKGIEGEFIQSWDDITDFYQEIDVENKADILSFISKLRDKGYDKKLRAGQSLYTFILSRSRRYGLEEHQQYLTFSFRKDQMIVGNQHHEEFVFKTIELNSEIEKLLTELDKQPID